MNVCVYVHSVNLVFNFHGRQFFQRIFTSVCDHRIVERLQIFIAHDLGPQIVGSIFFI